MNRSDHRHELLRQARDSFLRAGAALTEAPTDENLAFALLEGALGLRRIAQADEERTASGLLLGYLHAEQESDPE